MFQKGDLVKWHELYGDISIVKESGVGIVISFQKYDYFPSEKPTYIYRVYRSTHNDYMNFEEHTLEFLKGEKNEIK